MSGLSETLATVQKLQRDARRSRKKGDLDTAEKALASAAEIMEKQWVDIGPTAKPGIPASEEVRKAADMFADTLGSLAGIQRRQGRDAEALANYARGMKIESNEFYLATSTYNRVQWLVTAVTMNPEILQAPDTQAVLAQTLATLKRQTATTSGGDPWAWADLLLVATLKGDEALAEDASQALKALNPVTDVYTSGLPVLNRLSVALPDNSSIRRAADWYATAADKAQAL